MARVVQAANLPQLTSTRDTRARIDLVTEETVWVSDDQCTWAPAEAASEPARH